MQLIGQIFEVVPADAAGWIAVASGLALFGALIRLDQIDKSNDASTPSVMPVQKTDVPPCRLEPGSEWQRVADVALRQCASAGDLPRFQSRAAEQLDSVDYELARVRAECANIGFRLPLPEPEPVLQLVRQPARPPVPRTMAA